MNKLKKITKTFLESELNALKQLRDLRKMSRKKFDYYSAQIDLLNYLLKVENKKS
jgi:hypothetical protein